MIKRCFYKQDHGDGDDSEASSSSSSSSDDSDSLPEVGGEEEEEEELEYDGEANGEEAAPLSSSPGSGYESEDSSGNEVEGDASGLFEDKEDEYAERDSENNEDGQLITDVGVKTKKMASAIGDKLDSNDPIKAEVASCILQCKSVYKCRICPRIICLNESSVRSHLTSKRHARSKKLLGGGRLKMMLNSDGEIEEEQETHAERHARTLALAQEVDTLKRSDKDRPRRPKRKKRLLDDSHKGKAENFTKSSVKRRRKNED